MAIPIGLGFLVVVKALNIRNVYKDLPTEANKLGQVQLHWLLQSENNSSQNKEPSEQ